MEWLQQQINLRWPGSRIYLSAGKDDLGPLTRQINEEFDGVIACGGDGTVSEIASHAFRCGTTLGVLPMGSGNDFAKSLGISVQREKAIAQLSLAGITTADIVMFDTGAVSGHMINTLGVGLNGEINRSAARIRRVKGALVYIVAAIRSVLHQKPFRCTITADGITWQEELLMITVANGHTEGGTFRVAPRARINDGILELITVRPAHPAYLFMILPLFFFGAQFWSSNVQRRQVRVLRIESDRPVPIHVDGEQVDPGTGVLTLSVIPAGLRVLTPPPTA